MSSFRHVLAITKHGLKNYIGKKPYCVSFEVTYSCNAKCQHCHLGKIVPGEKRAAPEKFAERCRELSPLIAQVSGGEPLLRKDVEEIVRALKEKAKVPYITLTTNGSLLTRERYMRLREAGVDSFSLSFDYPDERHDEFRGIPGLFQKIVSLLEGIQDLECKAIALSGVVQRDNFRDLIGMAEFARKWDVKMNFSTYTWLRTHKKELMVPKEELPELAEILEKLRQHKRNYPTVVASDYVFKKMIEFFQNEAINHCKAGQRFLVVNPEGTLSPCGLIIKSYNSREVLLQDFLKSNTCGACYTSIRANTEKPLKYLIQDSLRSLS
jgi:MoaA/NifB/PqqE/SkfB family radical SAM enzyme